MDLKIRAIESKFKHSLLSRNGKRCSNYKVVILVDIATGKEYGYRINEDKKFKFANIGDIVTNFELQQDKVGKIIISKSNYDKDIIGMQLVKPFNYNTSKLIKI